MGRGPDVAADTRLAGGQERAAGGLLPSSASCAQVPLRMSVETVVHHAVHHRRPATRHGYTGGELCTETDRVSAPSGRQELGSPCRIPGGRRGLERRTPATHHPAPQLQNIAAEKLLKVFAIGSARDYVTAESAGTAPEQAVIPVTQGAACGLRRAPWPQRQQLSGAQDNSRMSHTRRRPAPNAGAFQRYGPSCSWCSSTLSAGRGRGEGRNTGGHHDSVTRRCRRSASSSAPTTVRTGVPGGANMVTTSCDCVSRRLLAPW